MNIGHRVTPPSSARSYLRRGGALVMALAALWSPALVSVQAAGATSPTSVIPGTVTPATTTAGSNSPSYTITFTTSATGALGAGGTITFVAPDGTAFLPCSTGCPYTVAANHSHSATVESVALSKVAGPGQGSASSTNNEVVITLGQSTIGDGDLVTVTAENVENPTVASANYKVAESTSADTQPVDSSAYAITSGQPVAVVATGGDNQTTPAGQAFGTQLVATVVDSHGNPVTAGLTGDSVKFSAPASGASLTFAGSATATSTDSVAANGQSTAPTATANGTTGGPYSVTATLVSSGGTPVSGVSVGTFEEENAAPLSTAKHVTPGTVTLSNSTEAATANYTIPFTTSSSGALGSGSTIVFVAPNDTTFPACSGTLSCSNYTISGGGALGGVSSVTPARSGTSSTNNKVTIVLGTGTSVPANGAVQIAVTGVGNPTVASTTNVIQESTNVDAATASSPDYTINPGTPTHLATVSGGGQTAQVGTQFPAPLQVAVLDANGNGVSGKDVTFSIGTAGSPAASATFANTTATEDDTTLANGVATTSLLTANANPGGPYSVTASVSGIGSTTFSGAQGLTNTAGQVVAGSVTPTPNTVGADSTYQFGFTTSDTGAMPPSGGACPANCTVTIVAPAGTAWPTSKSDYSASLADGTAVDISGVTVTGNQVVISVNSTTPIPKDDTVSFTVDHVTNPSVASTGETLKESTSADNTVAVSPAYTITPGAAAAVSKPAAPLNSGDNQSAAPGATFAQPLQALVVDSLNNPVSGVEVHFTINPPSQSSSPSFATTCSGAGSDPADCFVATSSNGIATTSLITADDTLGPFTVTAAIYNANSITPISTTTYNLTISPVLTPLAITVSPDAAGNSSAVYTVPFITSSNGQIPAAGSACPGTTTPTCEVTLTAPNGTTLPASAGSYHVAVDNNHAADISSVSVSEVQGPGSSSVSSTPNQVVIGLGSSSIAHGDTVTFTIDGATNPTVASSQHTFSEATSTDSNAVGSPSYTIGAAPATTVSIVSGTPQSATVNTPFTTPLAVQVLDAYNNPVPDETIEFTAPPTSGAPSGTFDSCPATPSGSSTCSVTTDSNGDASAVLSADQTAGAFQVTVSASSSNGTTLPASGIPVFSLTNTAGGPQAPVKTAADDNQQATVGTQYPNPLEVTVKDSFGNAVSGVRVTFSAPTSGPSVTFATCSGSGSNSTTCVVQTGSNGVADTTAMTANATAGSFTVTATTDSGSAGFSLTNLAGAASSIGVVPDTNGQHATVGTPFGTDLQARVVDASDNPVQGAVVTFSAPASGPSGTFATCPGTGSNSTTCIVATDSNGVATASTLTADRQAGAFSVTASFGNATPVAFDLTNDPDLSSVVSGDLQKAIVGQPYGSPLQMEVTDRSGNPLANIAVTFTAPGSGAGATFAPCPGGAAANVCTVSTDANGVATSSTLTANSTSGSFEVQGTADGVQTQQFTLTNIDNGYWLLGSDGGVFAYGSAPFDGSEGGKTLNKPVVGMARAANGGYYLVAADGGIFSFGGATFYGSHGGKPLNAPIVGMAVDPMTGGYWLVGSDGGVFAYGAPFYGSKGGTPLNKPVVGIAATPQGGYYLVASDGGIFSYGPGATFYGSKGGTPLNKPIVGMTVAPGGGYYMVASDGGIFSYGAPYHGNGVGLVATPVVGMSIDSATGGYWLATSGGQVIGDAAPNYGDRYGRSLNGSIVGIAASS